MRHYHIASLSLGILLAGAAVSWVSPALGAEPDPTPQITAALPAEATVKPRQPRKLLVFKMKGGHSLPVAGVKAMELMGRKTGAWSTTISDDRAVFEAESLKGFDAVCIINNTSRVNFFGYASPKATKEEQAAAAADAQRREDAFLAYVRGGKGFIGIHSAIDSRSEILPELFSGRFVGEPWDEKVGIRIDDPEHALTKSFGVEPLEIADQIAVFNGKLHADFRKKIRVLLTLDMTRTAPKGKRADQDYAVAWVKKVGEGRLFYSSLGHHEETYWNPKILRFYMDGIQFVLGDLEADTRPSAEVGIAPPPVALPSPESKTRK